MSERLPTLPERRVAREALRNAGLSSRQADALLRGGWSALVGAAAAEAAELQDKLAELADRLTRE